MPTVVSTAFSSAGLTLANAIQLAGAGGDDVTVTPDSGFTVDGLGFVDSGGGALDGDASGLFTLEGRQIFLYADPNNDNVVVGREGTVGGVADPSGAIVLAVFLQETTTGSQITGGKFWSALFEPLKHTDANDHDFTVNLGNNLKVAATQTKTFFFDDAPSGANEFMMFGDNPGGVSTTGIVVTGRAPDPNTEDNDHAGDTVSSSQAGPHATVGVNGQHLAPGNGINFTMVTNPAEDFTVAPNPDPHAPEGLSSTEADHEGNIQFGGYVPGVTSTSFTVAQVNPTGNAVTVKISAFNDPNAAETGTGLVEGFADDVAVNITEVKINGVVVAADLTGNTAIVSGVVNGDVVTYTTTSAHTRVLIENNQPTKGPGSNITLDIGGFTIVSAQAATELASGQLQFDDDGPTAGIVQGAPTVAYDETAGIDADADDTTAAAVVTLFAGVANASSDLSPTGYAQNPNAVVSSTGSSFGADAAGGTTAFSLDVSAAGVDSGLDTTDGTGVFLFKEGALVVGRIGDATGAAAFAVAINSTSGVVSVAQYASLKHPTGGASHDEAVNITDSALLAVVTVTDGDGDTATSSTGIGDAVQFQDDGPTAGIAQGAPTVAHDETTGVDADADDTTAAAVVALFAGVTNLSTDLSPAGFAQDATPVVSSTGSAFGQDEEGGTTAFSLAVSAAGVDSGLDTTSGTSIFLFKEGDLVVGRIGSGAGAAAFAVAINSTSGIVSVAQYASLKHPDATDPDDTVSITDSALRAVVTVTDGDGDTATSFTGIGDAVQFQDDGPAIGPIADGLVDFDKDIHNTVTKSLNGSVGADDPATYSITSFPLTQTILDGTSGQVTLKSDLTNSGTVVTYYQDLTNNGHTADDFDFFRLTLSGGNYTFDVLRDPPPAELNFNFAGAPSGSNLFMTFGDPTSTQIVVIGEDPLNQSQGGNINTKDVLNISQAQSTTSFGVNGNQINPDEGAFFTYVTGANTNFLVPNLDQNEADIEANIDFDDVFNTNSASFTVNQTNPGKGPVTVKITAFTTAAETGVNFVDGLTKDTQVDITTASVVNFVVGGETTPVATVNADGTLTITGLSNKDQVKWTTSGTHDRVLIENISNADANPDNDNNTFDIGGFTLTQAQPAPDEKLDFTVRIADADGDTASDSFSIGIDGTGINDDDHVVGVDADFLI